MKQSSTHSFGSLAMLLIAIALFWCTNSMYSQVQHDFSFNLGNTPQGGAVIVNDIAVDASGSRYVTGSFKNSANLSPQGTSPHYLRSRGLKDIFVAKYNASGEYLWAFSIGQANDDEGNTIAVDGNGNVYVAGYFNYGAGIDFNPGSGTATLSSTNVGAFFAKYDTDGNYIWAKKIDATGEHIVYDLTLDGNSNVYISGTFANVTDFDPGSGTANLTPSAIDMFFAKYSGNGEYILAKCISGSTSNDIARSIAIDANSNIYVAGGFRGTTDFDLSSGTANLTSVSTTNNDIFYAKYDATGSYVFARAVGNSNDQQANSIAVNSSGSIFLTGYFYGTATTDFDPGSGTANLSSGSVNENIFVARYDTSGNYTWAFKIGVSGARGIAIGLDAASNVFITGFYSGTVDFNPGAGTNNLTSSARDIFCAKYDPSGTYLFAFGLGGSSDNFTEERGICLTLDASDNLYIGGKFLGNVDFNPGSGVNNVLNPNNTNHDTLSNGFHAKYSNAGEYINAKSIGGISMFPPSEFISQHVVDDYGNVYLTGSFTTYLDVDPSVNEARFDATSYNDHDIFFCKYSPTGVLIWGKKIGGTASDQGMAITIDNSGKIVLAGIFEGTVDFDPNAGSLPLTSAGGDDMFIAKYDTNGTIIWAKRVGGTSKDTPNDITIDSDNNILLSGNFLGTADFNPNPSVTNNLTSVGASDIVLAKFTSNGDYVWAHRFGGTLTDESRSLKTDAANNIYFCGYFSGTNVDFDPGAGTTLLTSTNSNDDAFFAKFDAAGAFQWVKHITGSNTDRMLSIALDGSSNIITLGTYQSGTDLDPGVGVVGGTTGSSSEASIVLAKYNNNGDFQWADIFNRGINGQGTSLTVDSDDNIYMATHFGQFANPTVDFNPGSGVNNITTNGSADIVIGKYSPSGAYIWAKSIGGTKEDFVNKVSLDENNTIYLSGTFRSGPFENDSADFDPGTGVRNLVAEESDAYLAKYKQLFTITATAGSGGSITPAGETTVLGGESQSYTITPSSGYCVSDVIVDGISAGQVGSYTFANVKKNHTIQVVFTPKVSLTTYPSSSITLAASSSTCGVNATYPYIVTNANSIQFVAWDEVSQVYLHGTGTSSGTPSSWATGNGNDAYYPVGVYTVRIRAIGNCDTVLTSFTLNVLDVTAPVPTVATLSTISGECNATATAPTASDNCSGTITATTSDPLTYTTQGTHTIHWLYDDGNGNTTSQDQTVIIDDVTAPVPTVATLSTISGECNATATAPTASDNCSGTITATTSDPLTYTTQGTYTIHWLYDDGNGNTTSQDQTVIIDDVTAPVPSVATLSTISGECNATATAPTASDNCSGTITATTSDPLTYTTQGSFTIHWLYDDGNGNTTSQDQTVIIHDVTAPVPTVATLSTISGECNATATAPTASDNCSGTITATTSDPLTYTTQGTYTIHWVYDDGNGNTTSQDQTVIIDDVTAPVPSVATLSTISDECNATATAPTASDNCNGTITATTSDPLTYTTQGTFTIHWLYDDGNGNTTSQDQTVIIDDVTAPVPDMATLADSVGSCFVTVVAPMATDNCRGSITGTTSDPTTYTSQGTHTVHWTFSDGNGNTYTQNQTVIVDDTAAPTAICKNITRNLTGSSVSITASDVDDGSEDGCGIESMSVSPSTFTSAGTHNVTLTVNDIHGNSSTCTSVVTVNGNTTCSVSITSVPTNNTFTGGNPNILYLGYGPQSTTLQTSVVGGSTHTYSWSPSTGLNSTTAASPVFSPSSPGIYTFTVTVTNNNGCTSTKSESICVLDIRVTGQNNKVYVCHGGSTLQISTNAVQAHIVNHTNDKLGACNQSCGSEFSKDADENPISFDADNDIVHLQPNPFNEAFTLLFHGNDTESATIEVYDVLGRKVQTLDGLYANTGWTVGSNYKTGIYIIHFTLGHYKTILKAIKIE
ncbi:MAG: SBBP repeat-containing protein [Ignavibacteria bacterium]|nr:SBBP repeat-containing protein [Ignavibacteria bacterium]